MQESFATFVSSRPEGSAPIFLVPPSLEALQGAENVDVQIVEYKASTRAAPPAEEGRKETISSAIVSMTLRVGGADPRGGQGDAAGPAAPARAARLPR